MHKRSLPLGLVTAIAFAAGSLGSAQAATINVGSDSGSIGNFKLTNLGNGDFVIDLTVPPPPQLTQVNGKPLLTQANFDDHIYFKVTSTSGGNTYTITSANNLPKIFSSPDSVVDPTVEMAYTLMRGQAGTGMDSDGLILAGLITAVIDPTFIVAGDTYDFSGLLGKAHTFVLTATDYTGTGVNSMADVLRVTGATAFGSGSYSEGNIHTVIPEPTSVALLGVGLSGLLAFRRRFAGRARVA